MPRSWVLVVAVTLGVLSAAVNVSAEDPGLEGEGEVQNIDFGNSPIIVQLLGRSPNLLIRSRVNASSFLKLRFGELKEVDPTAPPPPGNGGPGNGQGMQPGNGQGPQHGAQPRGRGGPKGGDSGVDVEVEYNKTNVEGLQGRRAPALAQNSFKYENGTIDVNGSAVRFVRLTVFVSNISGLEQNYTKACGGTGFLNYTQIPADSYLRVTVFVTQQNTSFAYGDTTIVVPANNVKFNVEINNWPFCKPTNYLVFAIETKTNQASPPPVTIFNETQYESGDFRRGRGPHGPGAPREGYRGARIPMDHNLDVNMDMPQYGYDRNNTQFNGTHWKTEWNTSTRSFRLDTDSVDQDDKKVLRFFFPGNVTYMFYDPVLTVDATAAEAVTLSPPSPPPPPPKNAAQGAGVPTLVWMVLAAWLVHSLAVPRHL